MLLSITPALPMIITRPFICMSWPAPTLRIGRLADRALFPSIPWRAYNWTSWSTSMSWLRTYNPLGVRI